MVTAPIHKEALRLAHYDVPGHTELLAKLSGVGEAFMMLYLPPGTSSVAPKGFGVVHVTLHIPLAEVSRQLTRHSIAAACRLAHESMRSLGVAHPRIGVAGLNPHAGEAGLFGREEIEIIAPAVAEVLEEGIDLTGPLPADAVFPSAVAGEFDCVVAMYHDQAHVLVKSLARESAVNITLGLPIWRTSVAHGTAFDIAWKGTASPEGVIAAARSACQLANQPPLVVRV